MALKNEEVLENLKNQLKEVTTQLNTLTETRIKLLGAVDVLEQIEDSKKEESDESNDSVEAEVVEEGN